MATNQPPAEAGLSGQVLFYNNPEPLDSTRHAKLGMISTDRPYSFAVNQHYIPLHVGEFGPASVNYPIIFAGPERAPVAVMGLKDGENLFIEPDGRFRPGAYIPAFIRRYPFVGARDAQAGRVVVCIDRGSSLFTETNPDVMLFENGEPTAFTKHCIEFCGRFDADRAATEAFSKLVIELDLLDTRHTLHTAQLEDGTTSEPRLVAEYFSVTPEKLKMLPPERLVELRDNGGLAQMYAQMNSLFAWDRIVAESVERLTATPTAANA